MRMRDPMLENTKINLLEKIKKDSSSDIEAYIENMSNRCESLTEQLTSKLPQSVFTVRLDYKNKKILEVIFLSLVLSSYSTDLIDPFIRQRIRNQIQNICDRKGYFYDDLLLIIQYEDSFIELLRNHIL